MIRGPVVLLVVIGAGTWAFRPGPVNPSTDGVRRVGGGEAPVHAAAPPAGHSGGFGEPTCRACHDAYPLNAPGGSLTLEGLPRQYRGGEEYALTVVLSVPETITAGFQLTARHADGRQAGRWVLPDGRVAAVDSAGVSYAGSTRDGAHPASADQASWSLSWVAPASGGVVRFHLAANSGNGDDSPFGDLVYATSREAQSAR